jgi:hypothetical protein
MTNPGSDKPDKTPDLAAAAKQLWFAAKAKAKEVGQKATEAAKDLQAKAQQSQSVTSQSGSASSTTSPAGEANPTAPASAGQSAPKLTKQQKRGCLGCLGVLVVLAICGGLGQFFFGPTGLRDIQVNGSEGTLTVEVATITGKEAAARRICEAIYWAAKKYPKLERIAVTVMIRGTGGWEDKYGKNLGDTLEMGAFEVTDLDEVRKYRDAETYGYSNEAAYVYKIQRLRHAEHLDGGIF